LRFYGAALVVNVFTEWQSGVWHVHTGALYPWRHLPMVPLYPVWCLAIEWAVTAGAAIALATSRRPAVVRIASRVAAAATFVAVLQRYSNHGVLLFLVALYLAIEPPDLEDPSFEEAKHPALGLVRAQLVIVYVFSAINKLSHGFIRGDVLVTLLGFSPTLARAGACVVVVVELALPAVLVCAPRAGIAMVVALHAAFTLAMPNVGSFGLAMVSCALLFLPMHRGRKLTM